MTAYKPRSAWTSSGRGGARLTGTKLVGIAWHWPGTSQNEIGVESTSATANRLRGYRNFHVGTRGWSDIGYNFAIDQAGRVWDLRGLGRVGAHCASASNPDANHEWMGVLLILGDRERPSARMIRACQDFTHDVFLKRWPGRTRDTGHGRAPGVPGAQTSCPGPFAAELIVDNQLNRRPQSPVPEEDDMTPQELLAHRVELSDAQKRWFGTGVDTMAVGALLGYAGAGAWEAREEREKLDAKLDALLAAQEGLDTPAVLARIDERHAEAAQQRQTIAETMTGRLDSIAAVLSEHADGTLDAEQVVQRIGELLITDS